MILIIPVMRPKGLVSDGLTHNGVSITYGGALVTWTAS